MKKLLLVLLVLALASFFFVGCVPVTPSEEEDCDYSDIAITVNSCVCYGCALTFQYLPGMDVCSELDYFLIALYDTFPFNDSCDIPWGLIPAFACTGDNCPFFCETHCLFGSWCLLCGYRSV
jgi:hypothetical protein